MEQGDNLRPSSTTFPRTPGEDVHNDQGEPNVQDKTMMREVDAMADVSVKTLSRGKLPGLILSAAGGKEDGQTAQPGQG